MSEATPFALLLAIAERSQALSLQLPAKENAQTHWNGLGFSLLGQQFVAPMNSCVCPPPPVYQVLNIL